MYQENIYKNKEADAFFARIRKEIVLQDNGLRASKQLIYETIAKELGSNCENLKILEIGCCIGDLLYKFQNEHNCQVVGVEPSILACEYAAEKFNTKIINKTFNSTEYFGFREDLHEQFDIIIADDVLSWMSRELILPCMASIDWLLKPGGYVYTRDYSPSFDFAYKNHHQPDEEVYNYKVNGGHKRFLLETGKYIVVNEFIRKDASQQKIGTKREDSMTLSDSLIMKTKNTMQPKLTVQN